MKLTSGDREMLAYICGGFTDKEIAERLGISVYGVNQRALRLRRRLDAKTRAQAVYLAHEHGLLDVPLPRLPKPIVRLPFDEPEVIEERQRILIGKDQSSNVDEPNVCSTPGDCDA